VVGCGALQVTARGPTFEDVISRQHRALVEHRIRGVKARTAAAS
jgi:pyruvate carboxylase